MLFSVNKLYELYMRAEDTYKIEEIGKITTVRVTRTEWELSGDAKRLFYSIYNDLGNERVHETPTRPSSFR